ncbi:MAG: hypothetical protein JNN28_14490, partial [Saprospiraceae bacterium]|nr:hypothetical protein [Saprospiraceae bacterium]
RLTPDLLFQTSFEDLNPVADTLFYSVRAVKLEVTPGGGAFYQTGTGAPKWVIFQPGSAPTAIGLGGTLNCNNTPLTLGVNFTPPNSSYQWYKPNGELNSGFTATEGGVYTVVVTAPNGCTTAAYATVYVDTLLPTPNIPSEVVYNCMMLQPVFTVPDAPANIRYFFNSMEVFPNQQVNMTGPGVFTVSSTANGCSENYNIDLVIDLDEPSLSIITDGFTLGCNMPSITLIAHSLNVESYSWARAGEPVFSTAAEITITEPGTYCVTVTAANTCSNTSCITILEDNSTLSVLLSIEGNPCTDGAKTIVAEVTGGTEPYTYQWSTGGNEREEPIPQGYSGTLTVTVTDQNNCTATTAILISPPLSVLALADEESSPGASDGYIDLLVLNGTPPVTFQWSNGSTTEDLLGIPNGSYAVTVSTGNGCSTVLSIFLQSVKTTDPGMTARIGPNPACDYLDVLWPETVSGATSLRLFDQVGCQKMEDTFTGDSYRMDVRTLPAGVYYLHLNTGLFQRMYRVVLLD